MHQPTVLLSRPEVQRRLGNVPLTTFKDLVKDGVIPAPLKLGRRNVWPEIQIEETVRKLCEARAT